MVLATSFLRSGRFVFGLFSAFDKVVQAFGGFFRLVSSFHAGIVLFYLMYFLMGESGGGVHSFLRHLLNAHPHATDDAALFILKRKSAFLCGLRLCIRCRRRILRLPILLMGFVIVCALLGGAVMPGCILLPVPGIHAPFFFHDSFFICFLFRSFFCRIFLLRLFFCGCGLLFPGAEVFIHQTILGHFLDDFISAPKLFVCYGNHLLPA